MGISEAITPAGLAYFTKTPLFVHFDHAGAFLPQRIAQNAVDLEPLARTPCAVTNTAFVHAHLRKAGEGRLVAGVPANGLRELYRVALG